MRGSGCCQHRAGRHRWRGDDWRLGPRFRVLGLGGSGGSALCTYAMRQLPVGVPKLMVSTVASGDTRPYVGAVDIAMMYSVVDIAGINSVSAKILTNAAGAIAGMAKGTVPPLPGGKPLVGATMFGVTTPCVTRARERLEELGYEVLVFHATGTGGQSMEALMRSGFITASLDVTTTELCEELAMSEYAVSNHLRVLEAIGLAAKRRGRGRVGVRDSERRPGIAARSNPGIERDAPEQRCAE